MTVALWKSDVRNLDSDKWGKRLGVTECHMKWEPEHAHPTVLAFCYSNTPLVDLPVSTEEEALHFGEQVFKLLFPLLHISARNLVPTEVIMDLREIRYQQRREGVDVQSTIQFFIDPDIHFVSMMCFGLIPENIDLQIDTTPSISELDALAVADTPQSSDTGGSFEDFLQPSISLKLSAPTQPTLPSSLQYFIRYPDGLVSVDAHSGRVDRDWF